MVAVAAAVMATATATAQIRAQAQAQAQVPAPASARAPRQGAVSGHPSRPAPALLPALRGQVAESQHARSRDAPYRIPAAVMTRLLEADSTAAEFAAD